MAGINSRQVQSYLFLWERKLLDRIRQLRKARGSFSVLIQFSGDRVLLHLVDSPEKISRGLESFDK